MYNCIISQMYILAYLVSVSCLFSGAGAYASHCVLDGSGNSRPVVGHINICPSVILLYIAVIIL